MTHFKDWSGIIALEGDSGSEYISAMVSPDTEGKFIANNDSSAECDVAESFDCVETFIDSNFQVIPFTEENIWVTKVFNDENAATIKGTRYFKKTSLVSPNGWDLIEEKSF
jgi:hypothetical protein